MSGGGGAAYSSSYFLIRKGFYIFEYMFVDYCLAIFVFSNLSYRIH